MRVRRRMMSRWKVVLAAAALLAGLAPSGCAYFNTFYHARKYYREAEAKRKEAEEQGRESTETDALYDQSIKKCAKIIVDYPKSRWVDDALLLMGNGFFYRKEYTRALKKYDELMTYYPQSPFVREARWMSGMAEYDLGELERAREIFDEIAGKDKDAKRRAEARVMLARSWQTEEKPARCIEVMEKQLREKDSKAGPSAYMVLGDCYRSSGDLESAVAMYQEAVGRSKKGAERFEAQLRVADGLQDLGRLDEAAAFYHELMGKEVNPTRLARLRLAMGRLLVKQGRVEDGIEMLKRVADDSQTPDLPAEAQFEIGRTYERVLEDFGSAVTAYDAVASKKPSRELGQMAQKRKGSMTQMNTYLEKRETASADSLPVLDFNIAEQYLLTLDRPGQALEHYRAVVDEGSNETLAAKSLLAIAWIREHVDGDSSGATLEYRQLVDFYPETEFADRAREALGLPPRPKPETVDTLSTEIPAGPPAGGATADSLSAASAAAVAASGDSTARPVAGADSARVRPRSSRPRGAERTGPGARPARGDSSATAGRKPVAAADSLARGARPEGPPRPPGLPPGWSGPAAPDSVPAGAPADTAKAREAKPGSGSGEARGIHLPDSLSSTGGQSQAADSTTGRVSGPPAGGENSGGEPSPPPPTGENHAVAPADSV